MDAFFASVEQHDDPSLRGRPVIVGGASRRGVVCAASYEARPCGVHSAMPMVEAMRRCPDAVVITPRHLRYTEVSAQVFSIFHRYTPLVEGLSLDEAFLDVTASQSLFGDGEAVAVRIRGDIRRELGLTASAGVAPCKFVAKIASDLRKPDGLVVVREDGVEAFLAPLRIERMWGAGPVAAERLHAAGYSTIGELARADPRRLERLLGAWGRDVSRLARGDDARAVEPAVPAKTVGAEETFERDLLSVEQLDEPLLEQSQRVSHRMMRDGIFGATVVLKLKFSDFTVISRRKRLSEPVCDTQSILEAALSLLGKIPLQGRRVRLTGVAVTDLGGAPATRLLPEKEQEKRQKVDELMLQVNDRFGDAGLVRAALLRRNRTGE